MLTTTTKPIIWVEGIIGAGKSTLAKILAEALDLRMLSEPVDSNPYLTRFYEEPARWAFSMQMELLMRRYAMQKVAAYESVSPDSVWNGCVLDRGLPGDRVFCKLHYLNDNISKLEWETYERAYEIMACSLTPPSLMIFLDVDTSVSLERVKKRARGAEVNIDEKYLQDLRKGYLDLISGIESNMHPWSKGMEVKRVPWNIDDQPVEPLVDFLREKFKI